MTRGKLVRVLIGFLALLLWAPLDAKAAELLMIEQPGCIWCERWHREIGVAYPKTEEGSRAPLRRVDISKGWPDDLTDIARERLTPTFVLIRDGVEIARLRGYPGEDFFWPMLAEMLDKLGSEAQM